MKIDNTQNVIHTATALGDALSSLGFDQLYKVALSSLALDEQHALALAELVWYEGYTPTAEEFDRLESMLTTEQFARVLCVLELLGQYPVCPTTTAIELQKTTNIFHQGLSEQFMPSDNGRYSPSKRWGLKESTCKLRQALLALQTRFYADSSGKKHGFSTIDYA